MAITKHESRSQFGLDRALLIVAIYGVLFGVMRNFGTPGLIASFLLGSFVAFALVTHMSFRLLAFPLTVAVWTTAAIMAEAMDRSWGALGIALVLGPSVNGLAALLGLIYLTVRRVRDGAFQWKIPLAIVLIAPTISATLIFCAMFFMDLHGC